MDRLQGAEVLLYGGDPHRDVEDRLGGVHLQGVVDRLQANDQGLIWWEGEELELGEAGEKGRGRRRRNGGLEEDRMVETGVGLQTDVDRRPEGCLPGGMKEVLEPGDVEEDPLCVVEGHHPDGGRLLDGVLLLDVGPHQEEDLHQGVISVAGMREVVVLGDLDLQLEEVEEMTEEETEGLLRGVDLLRGEALHPVVMKDDLMVEPGDVVVVEALLRGEDLLRGGEDLPQDGEILLPDDSETILQDATMDRPIGVVTDLLLLLLLHEMINPHRTNPLASLMKVGPRWPSVSRSNHSVWD